MKFTAKHISFQEIDGVFIFALGDRAGLPGEDQPDAYVIIQFGKEDDQDRALGLTGLYIETSEPAHNGYGKIERVAYDGHAVSISGRSGADDVDAVVATDMMTPDSIHVAVDACNRANASRPKAVE